MDIRGNGEIRLEILRFTRQKNHGTGSEDITLAFRIGSGKEAPEGAAADTEGVLIPLLFREGCCN